MEVVEARAGRSKLKLHQARLTRRRADAKDLKIKDQLRPHAGMIGVELDRRAQTASHGGHDLGAQARALGGAVA
ncbi:hypothetical protein D3C77_782290 [compost metagenome]